MITDLNIQTNLVSVDTVREADGLALSSRNIHLNQLQRKSALGLYSALKSASELRLNGEHSAKVIKAKIEKVLIHHKLETDYIAICDPETLDEITDIEKTAIVVIAAYCGNIRLIDNTLI